MNSDLLSVDSWMCLHVTHDMLMCCYLFFWFWHYWLFPTVEDTNSVFFPTENLPTSKPHSTPLLCLQRCVTLLVRSIFSVYTNMVMKIFTAELSSIMISITFPSLHNFLSSLELLVFLCLFNLPCFLLTYHLFIPKIISNYLKFLSIVPTYQVFQQFFFFFFVFQQFTLLGNMSLEAAVIWTDCSPGWYTVMILEFTFPLSVRFSSPPLRIVKSIVGLFFKYCCWEVQSILTLDP